MKNIVFGAFALALLIGTPTAAADLRQPAYKAPPPAPTYSWTGCYAGGGFGYGVWTQDHQEFALDGITPESLQSTNGGQGWLGTVQGGCDYQFPLFAQNVVIGAFVDYDWADIHGQNALSLFTFPFVANEKLGSQWAAGARLGWIPLERLLLFVSGGFTQARFDGYTVLSNSADQGGLGAPSFLVNARNRDGWFIGSGYEYALPWFSNLTWKTEYRYSSFDSATDTIFDLTETPAFLTTSTKHEQTVRTTLNWRFNWGR